MDRADQIIRMLRYPLACQLTDARRGETAGMRLVVLGEPPKPRIPSPVSNIHLNPLAVLWPAAKLPSMRVPSFSPPITVALILLLHTSAVLGTRQTGVTTSPIPLFPPHAQPATHASTCRSARRQPHTLDNARHQAQWPAPAKCLRPSRRGEGLVIHGACRLFRRVQREGGLERAAFDYEALALRKSSMPVAGGGPPLVIRLERELCRSSIGQKHDRPPRPPRSIEERPVVVSKIPHRSIPR